MTPAELSRTVLRSVRGAVEEQELSVPLPARVVVQPPPRPGCGDYASNIALQLAKPAGRPAREIAEILRKRLVGSAGIAGVEIAGPGFLNFTLGEGALPALVREVLARGAAYGERRPAAGPATTPADQVPATARALVVAEALRRIDGAPASGQPHPHPSQQDLSSPGAVELARLRARLGADEAGWALLRPAAHDPVRLPERPEQRESNPRFLVQYAYARTRALVRNAAELGFAGEPGEVDARSSDATGGDHGQPQRTAPRHPHPSRTGRDPALRALQTRLAGYPQVVEAAARYRAPDRVVRHLEATADAFFRWHDGCPPLPVGEEKPLAVHRARLALAEATGTVLANGLRLLGISAPEHL